MFERYLLHQLHDVRNRIYNGLQQRSRRVASRRVVAPDGLREASSDASQLVESTRFGISEGLSQSGCSRQLCQKIV